MTRIQHALLTLCEQMHRPFVQRLIALLVSGLLALLLAGTLLFCGYGTFVPWLPMQAARASVLIAVEWLGSTSLPATHRSELAIASIIAK
jgi:fatty acid desaturase